MSLRESYVKMMAMAVHDMEGDEVDIMNGNKNAIEALSVAGKEDCLHLAVFTPQVSLLLYIVLPRDLEVLSKLSTSVYVPSRPTTLKMETSPFCL